MTGVLEGTKMDKPFDIKDLEAKLKAKGMPEVEGLAKDVVGAVFDWIEESVSLTPSKVDDMAMIAMPPLKAFVMSELDKIK